MAFWQLILAFILTLIAFVYFWLKNLKNYWLNRNVPTAMETLFYLGRKEFIGEFFQRIYENFKKTGHNFVGCFVIFQPTLLLIDLDLIKRVFISDFESFPDRAFYTNIHDDPLSINLFRVQGAAWRRLRSKMTQTFSSGKMRYMFPIEIEIGERLVTTISKDIKSGRKEFDVRDLCARFTTDIIGSVAFGIECNSLAEPQTKFRVLGDKAFACFRPIFERIATVYPKFFQRLHMTAFTQELIDFYTKVVKDTIAMREAKNIRRNDFLDIFLELNKTPSEDGEPKLTIEELIGNVFMFFIGGYETSSSTMTYCLYELSRHPQIQDKARAEVLETLKRFDNQMSYDCLKEMRYLEMIVQETLRKHPPGPFIRRVARKPYQIPNTTIHIEEGVHVLIPIYVIHHDPAYYPEPGKFDPQRFEAATVRDRHPMTYLPFGAGPRNCIAERFAKMEVLLGIAMILKHFKLSASSKTPEKIQYMIEEKRIAKVIDLYLNMEEL